MTDRELMQQALDALEMWCPMTATYLNTRDQAITALRERLAQPDPDFYGYASRLAAAIWEQHYKDVAPQWKPLDDLIGVLTQIDNMTAGLTRLAQQEQEPVSGVVLDEHGSAALVKNGSEDWHCKNHKARRLYTTPPQGIYYTPPQRKPLTDDEADEFVRRFARYELIRAIEAAHGIKGGV